MQSFERKSNLLLKIFDHSIDLGFKVTRISIYATKSFFNQILFKKIIIDTQIINLSISIYPIQTKNFDCLNDRY